MLVLELLRWWYGPGLLGLVRSIGRRLHGVSREFSLVVLVQTLFAPWRQIVSAGGGSLGDRGRALVDNVVSRLVGASVRLLVILAAGILMVLTVVIGLVAAILWPLLPVLGLGLIFRGLAPW